MTSPLRLLRFHLVAIAALCALAASPTAAGAQWRTEPVPGEWFLSPLSLDFDARRRALGSWEGINPTSPRRFTALDVRAPGGGWTRTANLSGITWGNAQIHLYGSDRALLVAGQVSSLGRFNRARWRLVQAYHSRASGRACAQHRRAASPRSCASRRRGARPPNWVPRAPRPDGLGDRSGVFATENRQGEASLRISVRR